MAESIASLMQQLGAANYKAPSSFKGYQSGNFTAPKYKNVGSAKPWDLSFSSFDGKKDKSGINLWDVLTGTLGQFGGIVTNSAYNSIETATDKDKNVFEKAFNIMTKDSILGSLAQGSANGAKEQWKDWVDGDISWGDIPGVGFLHGADKGWKRGTDIMEDFTGVENKWGKVGSGIGIDIALDPLTYLTGGLSAASKLGKVAELEKMAELAKAAGMSGKFNKADDFMQAAEQVTRAKYAKYPNLVEKMVAKKAAQYGNEIKTARNTAINQNINKWAVSVPFSNKMTKTIGNISKRNPLYRTEAALGADFGHVATNLINKAAGENPVNVAKLTSVALARYGVRSIEELTKTNLDDLSAKLSPIIAKAEKGSLPDAKTVQSIVKTVLPKADFDKLMNKFVVDNVPWKDVQKQLDQILLQTADNPTLRAGMGAHLASMVSDFWKTKSPRNFSGPANARKAESMSWASRFLGESDMVDNVVTNVTDVFPKGSPATLAAKNDYLLSNKKGTPGVLDDMAKNPYNEMTGAKTRFEHFLDKHNPFEARTLKTGNKYLDSMANHIADGNSARIGGAAKYSHAINGIEEFIKKNDVSDEEMKQAIYVLEDHAPEALGKGWSPSAKVQKLADKIKPILSKMAKDESAGGVLSNTKKNYFPHVVNQSDEAMEAIEEFAKRHPELSQLNNLKQGNKFNQSRRSFQTLAQKDNYLKKLEQAIQKATDPDTIELLQKQQEHVADLFDTNVVSALTRRIKEGVRAKSMKAMQGELTKFGMMKSNPTDIVNDTKGLMKLDKATAKKLGLDPKGEHYMHEKVLDGMKRMDEIFTDQGMNMFARHLHAISDIWRPLVTYYKPAHYINNLIGNAIINIAAGVRMSDYGVAANLIKGYKAGTLTKSQMKLMDAAYDHNVISGGFLQDAHSSFKFDDPTKLEKIAKAVGENKTIKKVRGIGELGDDITRLANFVRGMNKYGNTEKAAGQVREFLFNYNELTNADKMMRMLVPFWNWTKRNIPLQMKLVMENPKFAMNIERVKQLFNEGEEGEDWQKETGVKIPFANAYTSVPSPTNDLNTVLNPLSIMSSSNPALKIPLEVYMNQKMYTKKPISYGSDNIQAEDLPDYLASNTGIGNNIYQMLKGEKSVPESILNIFKPVTKINTE